MADNCCQTTEDGSMMCVVSEHSAQGTCSCQTIAPASIPVAQRETRWQQIRGGVMFGVACVTSPCCTPLIVPLAIGLLAGTPVAAWLNAHVGAIYGVLTLISVLSIVMALRWSGMKRPARRAAPTIQPASISTLQSEVQ